MSIPRAAVVRRSLAALLLVGLAACSGGDGSTGSDPAVADHPHDALDAVVPHDHPGESPGDEHSEPAWAADDHPIEAWEPKKLRAGERRLTLTMPASYTPSAPNGVGTDDYRCFLLDPSSPRTSSSPARSCCRATPTSCTT